MEASTGGLGREEEEDDAEAGSRRACNSVVKVFVTTSPTSYLRPWTKRPQGFSTGSAFPIGSKQLLTNAHVVLDATVVRVRRRGDYRKYIATVQRICNLCDLALLTVEADDFWHDFEPLELDERLPEPQSPVAVVGYPGDSDNVCVTRGVVSRIDMNWYTHDVQLLVVQIDAAINAGNSGGPVVDDDGRCVGVAFEKSTDAEVDNVGYVIPVEVVRHFLADLGGVGYAGFQYQPLESPASRRACGLAPDETRGVRVRYVDATTPAGRHLRVNDVVLKIDGISIGYDGTVPLAAGRPGERVALPYLMSRRHPGNVCEVEIWREGESKILSLELASPGQLIPSSPPMAEYLLVGGLVFVPLTEPYLEDTYGQDWDREAPAIMVHLYDEGKRSARDEQIIVLAHALCAGGDGDEVAEDLQGAVGQTLRAFNGQKVRNLCNLASAVGSGGRWLRFEFENGDVVVVDGNAAGQQREQVMNVHRIQQPMQLCAVDGAA